MCYNQNMSNTLFIGKDLPDGLDFAEALADSGRQIFAVAKPDSDTANFDSEKIFSTTWNKSSAISAHSLLIKAETKLEHIDEVVFYFDTNYFCSKFEIDRTEDISNAVDTMINAFFYSTIELLKRLEQIKEKTTVLFLIREYPSKFNLLFSKSAGLLPASSIVSAAEEAFRSIAESFSTNVADKNYLSVVLAKCSFTNELYKNEDSIADWTASAFDSIKTMKNHQTVKQACVWNKVGAKLSTGFSLFR